MSPGVACRSDLPVTHNKFMAALSRFYRVQHYGKIAAGRIFHPYRHMASAGHQTVLLIFYGTGTHSNIGHNIIQIADIVRIKHFISSRKTGFLQDSHVEMTDGMKPVCHTGTLFRIRLVKHTFISFTGSPRLVRVYPGDDQQLFPGIFLDFYQAAHIVQHRIFIVCRAGPDNNQKFVTVTRNDFFSLLIPLCFCQGTFCGKRKLFFDLCRSRQFVDKFESHNSLLTFPFISAGNRSSALFACSRVFDLCSKTKGSRFILSAKTVDAGKYFLFPWFG